MMRVLHVVSSLPTKDRPYDKPFVMSQIESLRYNGVEIDVMNLRGNESVFNYLLGIFRIIKQVNIQKYDLIHAHYSYCGWCAVFQWRVPVIVSLMGDDLLGTPNKNGGQTFEGFWTTITTQLLTKLVKSVIVKSKKMKAKVRARHVFIVPNGVDCDKFKPIGEYSSPTTGNSLSPKRILFLGNTLIPSKNFALALKAIEIVKKNNVEVDLLNIYRVAQDEVVKFLNSSTMLLLTSTQEGSPNVIKEAMACNVPIVSTDVGDVRETISNTEGCFITSFSPEDVADKIHMALRFGKRTNGRKNIEHLEINRIAEKIISIYEQIIKNT
jgi:glycosyltransferase involved in cell wall biosynthesis